MCVTRCVCVYTVQEREMRLSQLQIALESAHFSLVEGFEVEAWRHVIHFEILVSLHQHQLLVSQLVDFLINLCLLCNEVNHGAY
jgi:hypothetical protein